jgi:hypothetical protein
MIEARLDSVMRLPDSAGRHRGYEQIASLYRSRVGGQKFMSSLVQYNRLWQSEIARLQGPYKESNSKRDAAVARQALLDSIASGDSVFKMRSRPRVDSLTRIIATAVRKFPTPSYVRVEKVSEHGWVVTVPLYTDIADTAFVSKARAMIENAWRVSDAGSDYMLKIDLRPVSPAQLFGSSPVPANGQHIDVPAHISRFPNDGVVLTTGGNNTYAYSHAVVLGPGSLARSTLVHEFAHMLGFRDNYFRAFQDRGADGYAITEVILDSESFLVVPENGKVFPGHFEELIRGANY